MEIAAIVVMIHLILLSLFPRLLIFLTLSVVKHVGAYVLLDGRELARSVLYSTVELGIH